VSANFATLANRFSTLDFRFAIARSTPSGLTEREPFIFSLLARAAEFAKSETSKISHEGD